MLFLRSLSRILFFFVCLLLFACGRSGSEKKENKESSGVSLSSPQKKKDAGTVSRDSLLKLSRSILEVLKAKDLRQLSGFIHPAEGLRFSPYAYIDTVSAKRFTRKVLLNTDLQKEFLWGYYDGSGEPIKLSVSSYFDKFVYDRDFLNAPQQQVNIILGQGNSLNNMKELYPSSDFTEFYFPGFKPEYGGMDWVSLRLVFKKEKSKAYLLAIIHDQWTI